MSQRSLIEPLENRQLLSLAVDLRLAGGAKSATVTSVGQVVNLEVWATVKGADATGSNEALQSLFGSLLSTNINGGAANGTLLLTPVAPFNGPGSVPGAQADLDGDGDLDVGSNNANETADFAFLRSSSMNGSGTVSGASKAFRVATAKFTVTSLKSTTGETDLVFRPRNYALGALWQEDGKTPYKRPQEGGIFQAGAPFVLKRSGGTTLGSLAGKVFNDTDGDGVLDTGETGRPSVKVYLDKDKDGIFDSTEPNKTTDASGNYSFTGLAAGSYRIRIVGVSGYRISTPSSGYYDQTVGTAGISGKNFGLTQKVLISGKLWVDTDNDGVKDSTETALSGWKVFIDKDKDGVLDAGETTATTDSSGNYSFKSLAAGSYRVRVVQPTGYTRIAPTSGYYDLTLTNGQKAESKNFRYKKP